MLQRCRQGGLRLAVDDVGAGYATTIRAARCDRRIGGRTIAEGIERPVELEVLSALGVEHGQGFLLGRPTELRRDTATVCVAA